MNTIPKCAVRGCDNEADPRWWAHSADGVGVMICDGHEGTPCEGRTTETCTCPTRKRVVSRLKQTGWGCPSQWEAVGPNGEAIYIRFRYGQLYMRVNGETVRSLDHSDGLDGIMSTDEMLDLLNLEVESYDDDE